MKTRPPGATTGEGHEEGGRAREARHVLAGWLAERVAATDRRVRREAGVKAYDALARWRWMGG